MSGISKTQIYLDDVVDFAVYLPAFLYRASKNYSSYSENAQKHYVSFVLFKQYSVFTRVQKFLKIFVIFLFYCSKLPFEGETRKASTLISTVVQLCPTQIVKRFCVFCFINYLSLSNTVRPFRPCSGLFGNRFFYYFPRVNPLKIQCTFACHSLRGRYRSVLWARLLRCLSLDIADDRSPVHKLCISVTVSSTASRLPKQGC